MIPVNPNKVTTLIVNKFHLASGRFMTARAAFRQLMNGRVTGVDASGYDFSWTGADPTNIEGPGSDYNWRDVTIQLYPDQPCLRSAPNPMTGEETMWPVPTIVVTTYHFGYHAKKGENVSTRMLYNIHKGICQYCFEKISLSEATRDHIFPRTLGGSNDDFNLVLACKKCNSHKDCKYPYLDKDGNLPVGTSIHDYLSYVHRGIEIRPEWHPYLYTEKNKS